MSTQRIKRVNEILRREIGSQIFRVMVNEPDFDISVVTITRVETTPDLRKADVWVSILAGEERRKELLQLLKDHRIELQRYINRDLTLKYTPRLFFQLDHSIEQGSHILHLLDELGEIPEPEPEETDDDEA